VVVLKSSKGQVGLMETMIVVVVFVIILVVALGFYFKFSMSELEETGQEVCLVSNTVLLSSIAAMPEVECSVNGNTLDCVDTSKLLVFDPAREYGDYFNKVCDQNVYFEVVYPTPEEGECTQNSYPDCSEFVFYQSDPDAVGQRIGTPVSLYYPIEDKYIVGRLVVEVLQ
jgi:hypothetical protein